MSAGRLERIGFAPLEKDARVGPGHQGPNGAGGRKTGSDAAGLPAQQLNGPQVIQGIDAAVKARMDGVESYIVTEHYAVFRGKDQVHPIAEMTVKTTYSLESGKS